MTQQRGICRTWHDEKTYQSIHWLNSKKWRAVTWGSTSVLQWRSACEAVWSNAWWQLYDSNSEPQNDAQISVVSLTCPSPPFRPSPPAHARTHPRKETDLTHDDTTTRHLSDLAWRENVPIHSLADLLACRAPPVFLRERGRSNHHFAQLAAYPRCSWLLDGVWEISLRWWWWWWCCYCCAVVAAVDVARTTLCLVPTMDSIGQAYIERGRARCRSMSDRLQWPQKHASRFLVLEQRRRVCHRSRERNAGVQCDEKKRGNLPDQRMNDNFVSILKADRPTFHLPRPPSFPPTCHGSHDDTTTRHLSDLAWRENVPIHSLAELEKVARGDLRQHERPSMALRLRGGLIESMMTTLW